MPLLLMGFPLCGEAAGAGPGASVRNRRIYALKVAQEHYFKSPPRKTTAYPRKKSVRFRTFGNVSNNSDIGRNPRIFAHSRPREIIGRQWRSDKKCDTAVAYRSKAFAC
jgi:hypothetical protein